MANRFDLVLFDFDGTLANSFPWFESVLNLLAERHRFRPPSPGELDVLRRGTALEAMRSLGIPRWRLPFIAAHFRRLMHDARAPIPLFAGTSGMLETLVEGGVLLAVVSSNSERNVRRILGTHNASLVGHFACGASLFGKARLFRRALRQTGVNPT